MTPEEQAALVDRIVGRLDGQLREAATAIYRLVTEVRASALEEAAKVLEGAQIFHCWGDGEIDGLDVQKRIAAAIRALKEGE